MGGDGERVLLSPAMVKGGVAGDVKIRNTKAAKIFGLLKETHLY